LRLLMPCPPGPVAAEPQAGETIGAGRVPGVAGDAEAAALRAITARRLMSAETGR
jgi:hypothetical protein